MSDELTQAAEEALPDDGRATETVRCGGFCDRDVHKAATVDVVVGATVGTFDSPTPHIGVAGVGSGGPEVQQWCVTCATSEFDIEASAHDSRVPDVSRYITARTVAAFALGVALALLLASVMVV